MNVVNKKNNMIYEVFDITYNKAGYPHFLIYKDGEWLRMSAKHFKPHDYIYDYIGINNDKFIKSLTDKYKKSKTIEPY